MDISTIVNSVAIISGLGVILGAGLGYASIKFEVKEDPKLNEIKEALPGANCGGCGFTGCAAFAEAVLSGAAKPNGCPVGGAAVTEKVSAIMGVKAEIAERMVSFIKCGGDCEKATFRYDYFGLNDCNALMQLAGGGSKSCAFGCLGGGSCLNACKFGAISMVNGIAQVDKEKCTACGMCVQACPKKIIEMIPYDSKVQVKCSSTDNGKVVREGCTIGCIGCKLCVKACEYEAIEVNNFLAKIDYEKCVACNKCVQKCPMKAINSEVPIEAAAAAEA